MVLSQPDPRRAVQAAEIAFDPPLEERQWGAASIDLGLGYQFMQLRNTPGMKLSVAGGLAHIGGFWKTMTLPPVNEFGQQNTFCLDPGAFILALTYESITIPHNLIALVEGRSTYARVGLSMHQTAPWIQPGWTGPIVLEIKNHGPVKVELTPLLDRPSQLTFMQLTSALPRELVYGAKPGDSFAGQSHPLAKKAGNRSEIADRGRPIRMEWDG